MLRFFCICSLSLFNFEYFRKLPSLVRSFVVYMFGFIQVLHNLLLSIDVFPLSVPEDQENRKIPGSRGPYNKSSNKSPKSGKNQDFAADGTPLFKGPKGSPVHGEKGGPRRRRTR